MSSPYALPTAHALRMFTLPCQPNRMRHLPGNTGAASHRGMLSDVMRLQSKTETSTNLNHNLPLTPTTQQPHSRSLPGLTARGEWAKREYSNQRLRSRRSLILIVAPSSSAHRTPSSSRRANYSRELEVGSNEGQSEASAEESGHAQCDTDTVLGSGLEWH